MTSYRFFKMAAIESGMYLRVLVWWLHSFKEVVIYLHTKFQWDISVLGWDKTTSGLRKWTDAILEFHFRFRILSTCSHQHVLLHLPTKFRSNQTNGGIVMRSYRFFKMAAIESEIYFRRFGDCTHLRRWKSISTPNFDEISQSTAESEIYFRV